VTTHRKNRHSLFLLKKCEAKKQERAQNHVPVTCALLSPLFLGDEDVVEDEEIGVVVWIVTRDGTSILFKRKEQGYISFLQEQNKKLLKMIELDWSGQLVSFEFISRFSLSLFWCGGGGDEKRNLNISPIANKQNATNQKNSKHTDELPVHR
jgi:hypothetical protein